MDSFRHGDGFAAATDRISGAGGGSHIVNRSLSLVWSFMKRADYISEKKIPSVSCLFQENALEIWSLWLGGLYELQFGIENDREYLRR